MTDSDAKLTREKMSKTPSWIMLGFVVGCVFAFAVQREVERRKPAEPPRAAPAPAPVPAATPKSVSAVKDHASLITIENVFSQYDQVAVWQFDLTQVALWSSETNKYSECFEVLRSGGVYYFRTIPTLTRPVLRPNPLPDAPLRFTEPEEAQLKRLQENSVWLPPSTDPN